MRAIDSALRSRPTSRSQSPRRPHYTHAPLLDPDSPTLPAASTRALDDHDHDHGRGTPALSDLHDEDALLPPAWTRDPDEDDERDRHAQTSQFASSTRKLDAERHRSHYRPPLRASPTSYELNTLFVDEGEPSSHLPADGRAPPGGGDVPNQITAAAAALMVQGPTELEFLQILLDPSFSRHDLHLLVGSRVQQLIRNDDAGRLRKMSPLSLALRRLPAIMLTVALEMGVGAMVGTFGTILEKHVVLVNFMPMISSICGNIGLQSSTSTLRALATGHASHTSWSSIASALLRETVATFFLGILLCAGLLGTVSLWTNSLRMGLVAGSSILLSAASAGLMGSVAPLFFKSIGLDPAVCAGPLETAVQDLTGISIYLGMARLLLT
ncbi:hypothetical protein GGF31_006337 [Allomyces arbusculus]|nr:hypothetical protein GGF31_006337 [Allomyces arbusculus]